MEKKYATFKFKVKEASVDEDNEIGRIDGYASTFGNVDLGRDVVERGAFRRTIDLQKGKFPILLDHDPRKQIGWNEAASEDEVGLKVSGFVNLITDEAKNRFKLAKQALDLGTRMGLSIGYSVVKDEWDREKEIRVLKEVKLFEYSFVTFPMNEMAGVEGAKSQELMQLVQSRGYNVDELIRALEKMDRRDLNSSPALDSSDSEKLHSVGRSIDRAIEALRR